jgi:hypothetical protein
MDMIELYTEILKKLNEAIEHMTSAEFDLLLQDATADQRQRAARQLLDLQRARLVLGNTVLGSIAQELKKNEKPFVKGIASLDEALERLDNVASVLNTVSKVVSLVGRVVSLL